MPDEVRDISIVVSATNAIKNLVTVADRLDRVGAATGKTDKELRQVDRTLTQANRAIVNAARVIVGLKNNLHDMSKELTASNRESDRLAKRLVTANKRLSEQKQIIQTQTGVIRALVKDNTSLATSYNTVANAADRATAAQRKLKPLVLGDRLAVNSNGVVTPNGTTPLVSQAKAGNKALSGNSTLSGVKHDLQGAEALTSSLRYSLYDVAATFGIMGAAATVAGTAVFRAGIEWDKNFANVVRTSQVTGAAVGWLKDEFLDLQSIIPVTSEDLATIGTLGGQMGVAAANLANFTEVTAKFAATSGVGVDEAATALSRLDELLPDVNGNYELLASTILRTGVNAVATEQQIVRGTSQIAAMGRLAGLTTPEVVALSSAMSSLGFSPELQRSVVTSSFSRILTATSTVTAQTEKFGAVLGVTGKQFKEAWDQDALGTYKNLLETIAGRGDAVTVLQDLGLASQRLTPNLLKLGQNTEVLERALGDTTSEWSENGELTRQYGIIANTVSARIQVMGQAWEALLVTLDQSDTVVGPLVDGLTGFLKILRTIAKTPGVSTLATLSGVILTLAGVTALGAAGLAAMSGGYIALTLAQQGLNAFTAGNTAATSANTASVSLNTRARAANAAANLGQAGAVGVNTSAMAANSAATSVAGGRLLGISSKMITVLPSILRFAGIIGVATAAVGGLAALLVTAPEWMYNLEKGLNGIDTPKEILEFDSSRIAQAAKDVKTYTDAYNKARIASPGGGQDLNVAAAQAATAEADRKTVTKDLQDSILELETVEEKYAAINYLSEAWGMSQDDVLKQLPDVASLLGEGASAAAAAQDETEKLAASQQLWAVALGTSDGNLASLVSGIQSAASGFFGFGSMLTAAYEKGGGGLDQFISDLNASVSDFESFYNDLGELTQRGGVQLATLFAKQGPSATQALTDSLSLTPEQISQIESQMALAAFYVSEEFANTFSANNAILAEVWTRSGNNPEAVAAVNEALSASMKGGVVDPAVIGALQDQFGFDIPVGMIPNVDPDDITYAILNAQAIANAQAVQLPTTFIGSQSLPVAQDVNKWLVQENGNSIVIDVDPATEQGTDILNAWRAAQYNVPIDQAVHVDTSQAALDLAAFRTRMKAIQIGVGQFANKPGVFKDGGFPNGLPKFAHGRTPTIFRGPGSGTSDSILARVSNGEAITRARAVRYYGPKMLDDINHMRFPKFAEGRGPVGYNPGSYGAAGQQMNVTVVQNYPTTRDPIKQLKQDAESVVAGIWS